MKFNDVKVSYANIVIDCRCGVSPQIMLTDYTSATRLSCYSCGAEFDVKLTIDVHKKGRKKGWT